ncbi:outer membrane protein assembly factor BamE [Pikeienuella sp. HZG-20]|uniref:outer membrane protein assembly factor BamE n=1 Tax=Paludibacillus litoralis TaxID=3133267 RepID=UPI0030EDD325
MRRVGAKAGTVAALMAATLALGACESTYVNHGFAPQRAELDTIVAGEDTRGSVMRKLGHPSSISSFDSDTWYYAASKVEKYAFYAPVIVDRKVVAVSFDANGLVTSANSYGLEDGKIINLVTRRTPTYGRELTVLQQIFGNLGKFNAEEAFDARGPGGRI